MRATLLNPEARLNTLEQQVAHADRRTELDCSAIMHHFIPYYAAWQQGPSRLPRYSCVNSHGCQWTHNYWDGKTFFGVLPNGL